MPDNIQTLKKQLNPKHTKENEPLSNHTTLKIGGPADLFFEAQSIEDLTNTVKLAKMLEVPVTVLGRGSNVLVSDEGIRGLVIKNLSKTIKIKGEKPVHEDKVSGVKPMARWESDSEKGTFIGIEFKDLDYDESDKPRVEVIMDSGVDLAFAISYLIQKGITGLQWYAGIPGTIGGAVFNNIHGGTHFISELIEEVEVLTPNLEIKKLNIEKLGTDYNKTRFQESSEVILRTTFNMYKGDVKKAKHVALEWAKRKKVQPRNSAGSVFSNITQKQREKFGYPTTATGYIVEHVLKMKGFKIGDAAIYPKHHNFIVNEGNATAKDYLAVMKEIYDRAKEKLGIKLRPEMFLLGFDDEKIAWTRE